MLHSEICFISIRLCGIIYVSQPVALPFCLSLAVCPALCCFLPLPYKATLSINQIDTASALSHSYTHSPRCSFAHVRQCVCECVCASACELFCAAPWPLNVCNKAQVWRRACTGSQAHKGRKGEGQHRKRDGKRVGETTGVVCFFFGAS